MSTTIANPSVYDPGATITGQATAAVTAKRFLAISGNRTAGGNIAVVLLRGIEPQCRIRLSPNWSGDA